MALAVSATALFAALAGLLILDLARFRAMRSDDPRALARLIAENSAAAIVFDDPEAARQMLSSVRVRPTVSLACAYRADGSLLANFSQSPTRSCPAVPSDEQTWRAVARRVPVSRSGQIVGSIYVERQ